jgi:hypothetical protein
VLTGYNTDVKHKGKTFHVQTEDKGVSNPILETLVYISGGQIIASRQYDYAKLVENGKINNKEVSSLLESQHRQVMRWIRGGKFDEEGPPAFGATIVSPRTFDEVVLEFIESQAGTEPIEMTPISEIKPVAGGEIDIQVLIKSPVSGNPAGGAKILVMIRIKGEKPEKIGSSAADATGMASVKCMVPPKAKGGFLLVEAHHGAEAATQQYRIE